MPLKRILFVDDDTNVLQGLQNLLRKQRRQWEMVFAPGGAEALGELERAPFDVIVSDMRMPGMDGADLLQQVRDRYPRVARIVLSGHAEREAVLRALPVAQQFLAKPCEADALRVVIERTCNVQSLLGSEAVRAAAGQLDRLPSVPSLYRELTSAISKPGTGTREIAQIVEHDPSMSAKLLQLVNSAYFGLAQAATSVQQAIAYLGLELLRGLVLSMQLFSTAAGELPLSLERLQSHAVLTARVAQRLLPDRQRAQEAFTAAIVHDIGKIVLALGVPEEYRRICAELAASKQASSAVERAVLGTTHGEAGAYLLGTWGLPYPIVEAVAYHHQPAMVAEGPREVLAAVHTADALVDEAMGDKDIDRDGGIDHQFLEKAGFAGELVRWRSIAQDVVQKAARA
jgi:HD-like signal output (HDOD) protein